MFTLFRYGHNIYNIFIARRGDIEEYYMYDMVTLRYMILPYRKQHIKLPENAYKSFMESQLSLKISSYCEEHETKKDICTWSSMLALVKPYVGNKFYNKFSAIFVQIIKFQLLCNLQHCFTWFYHDIERCPSMFFYYIWDKIELFLRNKKSNTAIKIAIRNLSFHLRLWRDIFNTISEHIKLFKQNLSLIFKTQFDIHSIYPKHRAITQECKRFINKIQRYSEDIYERQYMMEGKVFKITETWDFTFYHQHILDMFHIQIP